MKDILRTELNYFNEKREELVQHHDGRFVLIKGRDVVGAFTTEREAYEEGVRRFGTEPFLIKRVTKDVTKDQFPALMLGLISAGS